MKPSYNADSEGFRLNCYAAEGREIWEWRFDPLWPQLFTVSTNTGQSFTGMTRDDAAKLASALFKLETIMQINLISAPAKGDWHLIETIPAPPSEAPVSLPSDATAR